MKKAYIRYIRGLILLLCLILLSSCGGSKVDSEQTGIRFSAAPTQAEQIQSSFTPVETERSTYEKVTVTAIDTIKMRSGPSMQFPIIGEISKGESLIAIGLSIGQDWLQLRYDGSETGLAWVFSAFTDYNGSIKPLPTVTAVPLPP